LMVAALCLLAGGLFAVGYKATIQDLINLFHTQLEDLLRDAKNLKAEDDTYMLGEKAEYWSECKNRDYPKYSKFPEWTAKDENWYQDMKKKLDAEYGPYIYGEKGPDDGGSLFSNDSLVGRIGGAIQKNGNGASGEDMWLNYGGGVKNGDNIIQAGVGLNFSPVLMLIAAKLLIEDSTGYFVPDFMVSYERVVHIADKVPLSFGGLFSIAGCGAEGKQLLWNYYNRNYGEYYNEKLAYTMINIAGIAKYHINMHDKIDVYGALKMGVIIQALNYKQQLVEDDQVIGEFVKNDNLSATTAAFYYNINVGMTYYFTDTFGVSVETGWPSVLNVAATIKI
nr:hypothetical protein [Treponemataceae bacterium]